MKQILQSLKTGHTEVAEVPAPGASRGGLLIATSRTLVSAGTERMLVAFGKAGLLEKARQQPDKVRMVIDKIRTDGLAPTLAAVRHKLDQPVALGYCNVGRVVEVGSGVTGFALGDRVVSNGPHAERVAMSLNLCAKVPEGVSDEEAAFTVVGAIALQGIRLVQPTLGECVVVTGLGLIGLMAVQLLRAHGCRVLGLDFDPQRLALARSFGAEVVDLRAGQDPLQAAGIFSRGRGVDAVVVTAATRSSVPIRQAANMCRKRGRIVLVGVTGLELNRDDFYKKELSFQVSCSYGPGRYDADYEEKGRDYPVGYVRWTEARNFEAVLDMMADGRLDVLPLVTHRIPLAEAERAYEVVGGSEPSLGLLLLYPGTAEPQSRTVSIASRGEAAPGRRVSFLGAGNYATSTLIPAFAAAGASLRRVASRSGHTATHAGRKFGFQEATTDTRALLEDPRADAVAITTRHDSHGSLVRAALAAGKHVFCEKPLCLRMDELTTIEEDLAAPGSHPLLMVGFNRRFAPQVRKMRELLAAVPGPKTLVMTVNAGAIPKDHWIQDPETGGGRIVGEACHFIDLLRFLAASPIVSHQIEALAPDTATLALRFKDGSLGTIHYFANGHRAIPKERLEVFASGRVLQLDNFRKLQAHGWPGFTKLNLWRQDKGQRACAAAFLDAVAKGGPSPIPLDEILEVSRISIELQQAIR